MPPEKVIFNGRLYAIVVRSPVVEENKLGYLTPQDCSLQATLQNRSTPVQPHLHTTRTREVAGTEELLFIQDGRAIVDFFDQDKKKLGDVILGKGDFILLKEGGHGIRFPEKARFLEVKQGPFREGDKEKWEYV